MEKVFYMPFWFIGIDRDTCDFTTAFSYSLELGERLREHHNYFPDEKSAEAVIERFHQILKDPVTTTDRSQLYDQIKADAVKCGETFSRSYPFLSMARRCVELAYDSGARKYYEKAEYDAASRLVDERMGSRKVMDFPQIYAAIKASANIEDAIKAVAELCREKED